MSHPKIKKKIGPKKMIGNPTPEGTFKQAESYLHAAQILLAHFGQYPQVIFPETVCEAFSLELFLKCLLLLEGTDYGVTHDLDMLFRKLEAQSQAHVRATSAPWLAQMQQQINLGCQLHEQMTGVPEPAPTIDFEYALIHSRDAFRAFRYVHEEQGSPVKRQDMWLGKPILGAVRDRILTLRPEWRNISFVSPRPVPPVR